MAYTGIIATDAELSAMAGELVDATGWTEANKNLWMAQVEGYLSCLMNYDVATNYGTLNSVGKKILSEYAARYCATAGILYNVLGFGTDTNSSARLIAETMVQFHAWRMNQIKKVLEDSRVLKFLI